MKISSAVIFSMDGAHFLVQKPEKDALAEKKDYEVWDEPETYLVGGG